MYFKKSGKQFFLQSGWNGLSNIFPWEREREREREREEEIVHNAQCAYNQSWALSVFLNSFTNKKWFFAFFFKLMWLGVGFLNRTGAEIGYWLDKECKIIIFLLLKIFKNTSSAQLCAYNPITSQKFGETRIFVPKQASYR